MPKVNERINEMARIMCKHHDGKCAIRHDVPCAQITGQDCSYKEKALALFSAGYVHISDCENIVKQAKIDVLNKMKAKKYYVYGHGYLLHITESDIDELIQEVQNGEDKG